jgi:isopropylmalate/homocitrate/citramalate synthase
MTEDKHWWTSEMNLDPSVLGEHHFPKKLKIYDTTLRDGEQTIGVSFDKNQKLRIAQELDRLGVDRIEAGMPVVSKEDREAAELIVNAGLNAEIWGFCRSIRGDVDACAEVGIKHVICEIATSDIKMRAYNINRDQVLKKAIDAVQHAKSLGMYTAFFAVDSTRADIDFLETIFRKVATEGQADEMVIVDTLGVATPETMFSLTQKLKQWVDLPIMTHCHNDFGMAVSCTLFSAKGGADCAHVTINGLGEKTGNTDLAELSLAANLYGMTTNIDLKKAYDVAKVVEDFSGIALSPLKPVVGENVFKKESGVTVAQLISYPPAVEGYSPEVVGRGREILLSKKSGRKSIEYKLKEMGMSLPDERIDSLVSIVKELGMKKKGIVTEDEFRKLANGIQ